jgi:hypothetical protein
MSVDLEERPETEKPAKPNLTADQLEQWYGQPAITDEERNTNPTRPDLASLESTRPEYSDKPEASLSYDDDSEPPQTSRFNKRFKGLSGGKKWAILAFGGSPMFIIMIAVAFLIFMLLSGFQVGQVARVLKDFNYIFAVRNSRNFARRGLLAGIDPTSKYKISNKKSLSRLGLIDEANPERSILKFDGKPSLLSRRPQTLAIGDQVLDIPQGFGRNGVLRGAERRRFIEAVDNAILEHPDLGKMSSYARNRAAKATLQGVDIKLSRWSKSKRFFQDVSDWRNTVKDFYEDTGEKLNRAKAKVSLSTNDGKKASEAAEEALDDPDVLSDAAGSPSQTASTKGVVKALEESETAIAKVAKVASKVSVVEIVGWLCLFRDLKKVIVDGSLQRTYALGRLAAQSFTAYDQMRTGDTSIAAMGLTAKSYANFADNVSYQQAVFGSIGSSSAHAFNDGYGTEELVNKGYEPIPEDVNMWNPLSTGKRIILALGSIGISKAGISAVPGVGSLVSAAGFDDNFESFDDAICNALTTPEGIIGAVLAEVIIQIVIAVLTAGAGTAATQGGEQAAKQGLVAAAKEVGASLIGKVAFSAFRKEVTEYGLATALRGTIWTFTKEATKFAALTAGSVEAAALLEKLASAGSGADLGGVGPDFNYFNKASVGANFLGNSYSQKVNYGRPSTPEELAEVRQTQYEEVLLANKNQSFLTRLSLSNPRSPSSLFMASIHPDKSYFSKGVEYALSLPSLVFSPSKNNSIYSLAMNIFEKPDSSTFAQSDEEGSGYHVWFYSKAEEEKLLDNPSFDPDQNAEYVEPKLSEMEAKYGKCYQEDEAKMFNDDIQKSISSSTNLANLVLSSSDSGYGYCSEVLQEEEALRYRVYKADQVQKQHLEDVANATDNPQGSGGGSVAGSFSGDKQADTSNMQCPSGSDDLGVKQIVSASKSFGIRLCKIPSPGGDRGIDDVNVSIAANVLSMVNDAHSSGVSLGGGGFRDGAEQVSLRRSNCGSSNYAIYQAPAGSCSPPTARPGSSNHELGLAIDFNEGGTISSGSPQFNWLSQNASKYGFKNLPSEPWHWSVDGK